MSVSNRKIAKLFKLAASLHELLEENSFKSRAYENAAFTVRQIEDPLAEMNETQLESYHGIGKTLSKKIVQIAKTGTYDELERMQSLTPPGLLELMRIKGIGAKKTRQLWEALGITSPETLLEACKENRLMDVKGFGKKTQENIVELIHFYFENKNKFLYAEAEPEMMEILKHLQDHKLLEKIAVVGEMRRKMPVISQIDFLIDIKPGNMMDDILAGTGNAISVSENGYNSTYLDIPVFFNILQHGENWYEKLLITTGSEEHLNLLTRDHFKNISSEEEIYRKHNLPYIIPEMREGRDELETTAGLDPDKIIKLEDIKGCIHNHSHYSDGGNTVGQMAEYCRGMELQYFGICDHSQTAFYANGMKPFRVKEQWKEVDKLNEEMAPFRIFKGIESDILNDGSLDYEESILQGFDFVVASVHSNLKMKEADANKRLLKAIENPYTTILGHMTARLLLLRAGFPLDHKRIIDACVANNVVIEINADPRRLDMDWKWYSYAIKQGAMFSINPDAHETTEMHNMYYGVCVARKGGITTDRVLNALSLSEIDSWFKNKKG